MNDKATYELILTDKLQSLPIPDMADAIWNRIEHRLDLDMPEGDGGSGGDTGPFGGSPASWIGFGFTMFVVAFLAIYLNRKEHSPDPFIPVKSTNISNSNPDTNNTTAPFIANPPPASPQQTITTSDQPPDTGAAISQQPAVFPSITADTSSSAPVLTNAPPPKADSANLPAKKPRGVSGISDADYRIVPKRDSN